MGVQVIRCESDAWPLLERCLSEHLDSSDQVSFVFEGWPHLTVKIDPGDGRCNTRIARALGLLQTAICRAYALAKYGDAFARLTKKERLSLEIGWEVHNGCTESCSTFQAH